MARHVFRSRAPARRLLPLAIALLVATPVVPLGAQDTSAVRMTDRGILVDFQDTDLRVVIAALAEAGNLNVIYGDLPPKRITLRMRQPVARENVGPLLRSIAQSNGLHVREEGGLLRLELAEPRDVAGAPAMQDSTAEEPRLFIYRLKHVRAARLAGTLQSLFGAPRTASSGGGGLSTQPLSERLREQQVPPLGAEPRVQVEVAPAAPSIAGQLHGEVQIVPDETTNSLLVRAQPDDWEIVRQAVETLDLRPLQVLIEVLIAEVRRTEDLELGVSGKVEDKRSPTTGARGTAQLEGATTGDFVLSVLRKGNYDVNVAISALQARGDVRILSRPVVFAQNNQEARILIGSERPFVQVFRSLPTDAAVRDQVVQYRDVGTQLTIVPTINLDGYVNLQISQEVSTATSETQFGAPVISTREASTHLFVKDGRTAVIGGLIDRQRDRSRSGIPGLSAIPGLGALFGTTRSTATNSELFLFLTPHIVTTDADAERVREGIEENSKLLPRDEIDRSVTAPATRRDTSAAPPRQRQR